MGRFATILLFTILLILPATALVAGGIELPMDRHRVVAQEGESEVLHRCLTPVVDNPIDFGLTRSSRWALPDKALAVNFLDTIHILVLRFNFQYETVDDPNTTGRGIMDLSRPIDNPLDSAVYYDSVGNWVDPPAHDSLYFDAHMRALRRYWETVSGGKLTLSWDIFPPAKDSCYQLPYPMSRYGKCDFADVVDGLENYFIDGITLADQTSPEIDFASYDSYFLFHAGSDRQNDVGLPETCSDLFTGFISFRDSVPVDDSTLWIRRGLLVPETASQDNRATALNAVLAHEFGHQLGLPDLYSTRSFLTQLGDFALMDNNGFGTGIDFGYKSGNTFGAMPVYPSAWSRAYLGLVDVYDFRMGTDITVAAAEIISNSIQVARIPITEKEYYLIENRLIEVDGFETRMKVDSATSVFEGPMRENTREFTSEYDFLLPGSGLIIYHVDEAVAGLDYDGDGLSNFFDNQLQWVASQRFIRLIEGDGQVHFGGYYRSGWGRAEDMYRDDRSTSFTPNTNPPSIDNSGNNTHIFITDITRVMDTAGATVTVHDSLIRFSVETDKLSSGFPVRTGPAQFPLSPIIDDLNGDGMDEIIVASGNLLSAFSKSGEWFLQTLHPNNNLPIYYDTTIASVHTGRAVAVPLMTTVSSPISAGPVTGDFGSGSFPRLVAFGYSTGPVSGRVVTFKGADDDLNGEADNDNRGGIVTIGIPIALSFGDILWALTDRGNVYRKTTLVQDRDSLVGTFTNDEYHGICRLGRNLVLMAGDATTTTFYAIDSIAVDSLTVAGHYMFGPVVVDIDRNGTNEIVALSEFGDAILVSADETTSPLSLSVKLQRSTGRGITANPVIADIDSDGYPDIIVGGNNQMFAFDRNLIELTDFPIDVDDRFTNNDVTLAPIVADIELGGSPEIIFSTDVGNMYAFGNDLAYGFPLSAGEQAAGSPLFFNDNDGGRLGYIGADGWFYLWDVASDSVTNYWTMNGADPINSMAFDSTKLSAPKQFAESFDENRFFCYPNPVTEGRTTLRYFLGQSANSVELTIYDLTGNEIESLTGTTDQGVENELVWDCQNVTPGVYRCRIEINSNGNSEVAFTDIAVIR